MKYVTIIIPKGNANLSAVAGSFEILTQANNYWRKQGNTQKNEIRIAGLITELKLDGGFFSIHPSNIKEIKKTDLVIIPPRCL